MEQGTCGPDTVTASERPFLASVDRAGELCPMINQNASKQAKIGQESAP